MGNIIPVTILSNARYNTFETAITSPTSQDIPTPERNGAGRLVMLVFTIGSDGSRNRFHFERWAFSHYIHTSTHIGLAMSLHCNYYMLLVALRAYTVVALYHIALHWMYNELH